MPSSSREHSSSMEDLLIATSTGTRTGSNSFAQKDDEPFHRHLAELRELQHLAVRRRRVDTVQGANA